MNVKRRFYLLSFACCAVGLVAWPATSHAAGRDAVKKAVAATVAVEWRADEKAGQPHAVNRGFRTQVARVPGGQRKVYQIDAVDPATGTSHKEPFVLESDEQHAENADLALASGTVVSADGLVVTLSREAGDGKYEVIFEDGRSLPARIVVDDRRSGLRLLKVDAHDLAHLTVADTAGDIGDPVFAAFCTGRRDRAAAQGMIAARSKPSWLQLDLAAGPMSAGAPLVDEQGRLIGVVSGKIAATPASTNFAIPLDAVRALLAARQGENTVVVHRGFLGIQLENKDDGGRERVIAHLLDDSPARAAGMADGDELVSIGGEKVVSAPSAAALVGRHAPGDKVSVVVLRDGQEKALEITAGQSPAGLEAAQAADPRGVGGGGIRSANVVRPEKLYVLPQDGKRVEVLAEQVDALRNYARSLRLTRSAGAAAADPTASTIRVERSDLDKKLEEVGRSVESLQQQIKTLTEEIQALRSKLAEQK